MSERQLLYFPLNPLKQFLAKIYYVCSCSSIPVDDHRHANALKLLITRTLPLLLYPLDRHYCYSSFVLIFSLQFRSSFM